MVLLWTLVLGPWCFPTAASADTNETHWSLRPVVRPDVPAVPDPKWKARKPVDNFIFAKLREAKLSPSPEAPRRVLIRRLYFDLLGLPPAPTEVRAFENDKAPDAYERLVERLLASPHYGERWARHWLDVVRFAETHGFEMNQPRANAWRYRDYVIDAFNQDKPYERFILEQFAGDIVGEDAATGFLVGGAWDQVKSPDPVLTAAQRADELHDMVSTTGSAFLGLTVGCARCHNHKFDPIPQADYYAIKACLSGVEHGDRTLHTPEVLARQKEAENCKERLSAVEAALTQFEPVAFTGRLLLLDTEMGFGSHKTQLVSKGTRVEFPAGTSRGERDDTGDLKRLPNFNRSCLVWSNSANADLLVYEPQIEGRFHLWLSWGCASAPQANEIHYLLDRDGDLNTTGDQEEIVRVDQRNFADGTVNPTNKVLWSGFYDGGILQLATSNKIVLRSGATNAFITASTIALVELPENGESVRPGAAGPHFLRAAVSPRRNVERFTATRAQRLRFTVNRTTDAEPCIDELEVYTAGTSPTNIALAAAGTKATASSVFPNSEIHRIEHLNDGKVGNSHSWISNERGKGWVELAFPEPVLIDRVIWGRDREQQFTDRLALDYQIEVAENSNDWHQVASSQDRVPYVAGRPASPEFRVEGLSQDQAQRLDELMRQRTELERRIKELSELPMAYAGKLDDKPERIYRLFRGDPMQRRELVEPGVLGTIPVAFHLEPISNENNNSRNSGQSPDSSLTDDQRRRLALAEWLANPTNPLPARVMVNRLWQHHFGEGLVSTPSDFGKKGALPTHPGLLDWLAAEFISPSCTDVSTSTPQRTKASTATPWSVKHIHRLIVTSAAYRQSSAFRREGVAADAASRLLWRYPPQRLEAEPLRDTILAVSGKLDLTPGGPGFSPFEPNDNYVRVYNPKKEFGPADWRRMIYMTKVRMQQDSTFGAFDCPDGGQIAPKRMRSTTPLQALNLLNSEFILQQAAFFAERLEREAGKNLKAQVRLAFELAYSRAPEAREAQAAQEFIAQNGLSLFCRALFNSNEFIFVE